MRILRTLAAKTWTTDLNAEPDFGGGSDPSVPAAGIGLGMFLAVVTVLFFLLSIAYSMRMELDDWKPLPELRILWLNTGVLVLSSIAMQWAYFAARRGNAAGVRFALLVGGGFAFAFLAGQSMAWRQLDGLGYFAATNPANAFFYLITAIHGGHLLGGLVAWSRTTVEAWHGADGGKARLSIGLCTAYWHFLLVVWLGLFALLLSDSATNPL